MDSESSMKYDIFVTKGLGNNSYLVESGGEAFLIDPQRDAWRFLDLAYKKDIGVKYVFETHVHNDYVSGMHQVREETGAVLALPGEGKYEFSHKAMKEGDTIVVGDVEVVAMATPGHTYEHMSWLVRERETRREVAIFTGGSLIVGSAGRTDLLGHHHHPILTEHQFETMQKYKALPKDLPVLPTHGAGSFCTSKNPSDQRVTSIGRELQTNAAFMSRTLEEFSNIVNTGLRRYPTYYKYMAGLNRRGVEVYRELPLPDNLKELPSGLVVVDMRERQRFASFHLRGSMNIEITPSFASYYGWLLPIDVRTVLVVPDPIRENLREAMVQLFRIGFEKTVEGYITEFQLKEMQETGRGSFASYEVGYESELADLLRKGANPRILDVRDPAEVDDLPLQGAENIFFAEIPRAEILDGQGSWVLCVSGERSAVAASLLEQKSVKPIPLVDGGVPTLLERLQRGA